MNETYQLPQGSKFTFIVGASGSGTTMMTRILGNIPRSIAIGGNHNSIPQDDRVARTYTKKFNDVTQTLWDRRGTVGGFLQAKKDLHRIIHEFAALPLNEDREHYVYKRSAPFLLGDRHRPDLVGLMEMYPEMKLLVMLRDPRASTFSSYRRDFADTLKQLAIICEEQLTYISAQLGAIEPSRYLIINYETFCQRPVEKILEVAYFLGLDKEALLAEIEREQISATQNQKWRQRLAPEDARFLEEFFTPSRLKQFHRLAIHLKM